MELGHQQRAIGDRRNMLGERSCVHGPSWASPGFHRMLWCVAAPPRTRLAAELLTTEILYQDRKRIKFAEAQGGGPSQVVDRAPLSAEKEGAGARGSALRRAAPRGSLAEGGLRKQVAATGEGGQGRLL